MSTPHSSKPPQKSRHVNKWLLRGTLLSAFLAGVVGIVGICLGLFSQNANALIYGIALITIAALLGLSVMNRMFPRK